MKNLRDVKLDIRVFNCIFFIYGSYNKNTLCQFKRLKEKNLKYFLTWFYKKLFKNTYNSASIKVSLNVQKLCTICFYDKSYKQKVTSSKLNIPKTLLNLN